MAVEPTLAPAPHRAFARRHGLILAAAGTITSFATFAVAFLARPPGAAVFGHHGDKLGRRKLW